MNLLLLRGLIRDHRTWGDFPDRLKAHAPRMKPYYLDLPGVGTENHRPSPTSIPAIRIEVAKRFHEKIARGEFPSGPWSLLAMSMGGMIALDWVDAEPDLFRQLVLINTSSSEVGGANDRFRFRILPEMLLNLIRNRPEESERLILSTVSNRFSRNPANREPRLQTLYEDQVRWRKERPVTRTTFVRQILSAAKYRLPNSRPKPETLLVSSNGDRLVTPECSERLALRLGVPHLSHPWAGHDIPIDDPEWLARELGDWMKEVR
jgi:pimeloyl-[acyl-carrier protein] methyl ester esterase